MVVRLPGVHNVQRKTRETIVKSVENINQNQLGHQHDQPDRLKFGHTGYEVVRVIERRLERASHRRACSLATSSLYAIERSFYKTVTGKFEYFRHWRGRGIPQPMRIDIVKNLHILRFIHRVDQFINKTVTPSLSDMLQIPVIRKNWNNTNMNKSSEIV